MFRALLFSHQAPAGPFFLNGLKAYAFIAKFVVTSPNFSTFLKGPSVRLGQSAMET